MLSHSVPNCERASNVKNTVCHNFTFLTYDHVPAVALHVHMHAHARLCLGNHAGIIIILGIMVSISHSKLHLRICFWSVLAFSKDHVGGRYISITATNTSITVNERWSSIIKMFTNCFMHAVCKLLRILKILKLPEACRQETRNRSLYNLEGPKCLRINYYGSILGN